MHVTKEEGMQHKMQHKLRTNEEGQVGLLRLP